MVMPMFLSMMATNLAYGSTGTLFGTNQARMGLANAVNGRESQGDIASVAAQDEALALRTAQAQTDYLAAEAMQEEAQAIKKNEKELYARLRADGAIFV